MTVTLYKRNAQGIPLFWSIRYLDEQHKRKGLEVTHGIVNKTQHKDYIPVTKSKVDELESRVKAKRKEGYKSLEDLYDNSPKDLPRKEGDSYADLYKYLDTYLPKYNTSTNDFVLPMLAKTLEDNTPFDKYGEFIGQWKINGLRCLIGAKKAQNNLFKTIELTYTSREGTSWNLEWMDEIILGHLSYDLIDLLVEDGAYLDGELYLPGYSVNAINSFVKNNKLPEHYQLQYWCYDIAVENMTYLNRASALIDVPNTSFIKVNTKEEHLNNKEQFVVLPDRAVGNIDKAIELRDKFISLGFEGLILRKPTAEYSFGKRNSSMFKFKKIYDGLFKIVGIKEDKRGLPIYTLQNDINSEYFEATLNKPQGVQKTHIQMKDALIGNTALVEYRERSGVKEVPFHAKIITIYV